MLGTCLFTIVPVAVSKQGGRDLLSNLSRIGCSCYMLAPLSFKLLAKSQKLPHVLIPMSDTLSDAKEAEHQSTASSHPSEGLSLGFSSMLV